MVSKDSVLSFTLSEAIKNSYCEGEANSVKEVAEKIVALQDADYKIIEHKISTLNKIIYFLLNPYLQGILLMLIIGGIYFEMQSPGIGFALAITIISAILYFAPLYLEGLAQNWELIIFLIGVGLIFAEIFVIPGFGIAGISGIILVIVGLAFAMVDNSTLKEIDGINLKPIIRPFAMVLVSTTAALFLSIYLASKLYPTKAFSYVALKTKLSSGSEGFVGVEKIDIESLVGKTVVVATDMKPQGV
jgi:Membrane-bound serine protease (ClpP class)